MILKKRGTKNTEIQKKNIRGKMNKLYIAIFIVIVFGILLLVTSFWLSDSDMKNIAIGLGTGIFTSAIVTLYIDIINSQMQRKKMIKFRKLIFNPLSNAVKSLYIQAVLSVNEYRIKGEKESYILLPLDDIKELSDFLSKMKNIEIDEIKDIDIKKRLLYFSNVSLLYYREVISQYEGLPFESLILDEIISQEEYDKLKHFALLNEGRKCLDKLEVESISEQEKYYTRVQLLHSMLLFINNLMKVFDFIASEIKYENERMKQYLDELYFDEVISTSDSYIEQQLEKAEADAEYLAEHPELMESYVESEEEQLQRKIDAAIWAGNVQLIKEYFPKIDKNNKEIQSLLTWGLAKEVMKNKELREMYYEKYGMKYKVRKEKRKRIIKSNRHKIRI